MQFLHTQFLGGGECLVIVMLEGQANVLLLDDPNFSLYRQGSSFRYFGGWATTSPIRLSPPFRGNWHVIVDLGGKSGLVRAGVRVVHSATRKTLF